MFAGPNVFMYIDGMPHYMCVVCCRNNQPKSAERLKMMKECAEKGVIPVGEEIAPKGARTKIQWTMNRYNKRVMFLTQELSALVNDDSKYSVYGPEKSNGEYGALIMAVVAALSITVENFKNAITAYFKDNNKRKQDFFTRTNVLTVTDSHIKIADDIGELKKSSILADAFSTISLEPDADLDTLIDSAINIDHFEAIILEIVKLIYDTDIIVIEHKRRYTALPNFKTGHVFLILFKKDMLYFVMMQDGNNKGKIQNNFKFTPSNKLYVNLRNKINESFKDKNGKIENLLHNIKQIAEIQSPYFRDDGSLYGLHIKYRGSAFYFPLPPNTIPFHIIGRNTTLDDKPQLINAFAPAAIAYEFLIKVGIRPNKYATANGIVYSILVNNKDFFISEQNLTIKALQKKLKTSVGLQVVETRYDKRNMTNMMNESIITNKIDKKSALISDIETAKQLTYPYYAIAAIITMVNSGNINISEQHKLFNSIIDNKSIKDKVNHIINNPDIDKASKKNFTHIFETFSNPKSIPVNADLGVLNKMPYEELMKHIETATKKIAITVKKGDEKEFLAIFERGVYSTKKVPLSEDMLRVYPQHLASDLQNNYMGKLFNYYTSQIYTYTNRIRRPITTLVNIEHVKVVSKK